MHFPKPWALALLALRVLGVAAEELDDGFADFDVDSTYANADVPPPRAAASDIRASVSTTFTADSILGLKLINKRPTKAVVSVTNHEQEAIQVSVIGGALWKVDASASAEPSYKAIVRNLTSSRYDSSVEPGETKELPYSFVQDMQPLDVRVVLVTVMSKADGNLFQVAAYNGTATIVETPTSFFDPQIIFLYIVLATLFGGTCYLIYKTWIEALFPQARRGRASRPGRVAPQDPVEPLSGSESSGVATGISKSYDESWIPNHHINRPVAKRVKTGGSTKSKKALE